MDTDKKPDETPKHDIGELVGDLVVSGATALANTAAKMVVKRGRKTVVRSAPGKAVAKVMKKAKKSAAASKGTKSKKKKTKKAGTKKSAGKKSAKKSTKKKSKKSKG
jgi:hypothetical protein